MGAGGVLLIIAGYIFVASLFGHIVKQVFIDETELGEGASPAIFFSGLLWPVAMIIWGGFFAARYLIEKDWSNK